MRLFCWMSITLTGLAVAGCGDVGVGKVPPPGPGDSVVHAIIVVPNHLTLAIGESKPLAVSVDAGYQVADRTVTWTSSDTTVATVSASYVTARAPGHATITAASRVMPNVRDTSGIQVVAPAAARATTTVNTNRDFGRSRP